MTRSTGTRPATSMPRAARGLPLVSGLLLTSLPLAALPAPIGGLPRTSHKPPAAAPHPGTEPCERTGLRATRLRCEYLVDPLGIETERPRLSWIAVSPERGQRQTAYRILVATSEAVLVADRGDLWDSGRVQSSRSIHVDYGGNRLDSRQRVVWKVRLWDRDGEQSPWSAMAVWGMGVLDDGWTARWIGDSEPVDVGRPAHNGYHSELVAVPETSKWVGVDLGRPRPVDTVVLFPARPFDWSPDTPGFLFPLRFRIEVASRPDFGDARTVVDRTDEDVPRPGGDPLRLIFEPTSARFVRLVVTRLRRRDEDNHGFALAELQVVHDATNLARDRPVLALDSIETGAWSTTRLVDGDLTSHRSSSGNPRPAPLLRSTFRLDSPVHRAVARCSALGLYELHLNGDRVGRAVLAPEFTNYRKRVQYQTLDVTDHLRGGENAVGVMLGDGWYSGRIGLTFIDPESPPRGVFGERPRFLFELDMELENGSRRRVVSDRSWRVTLAGPIRSSCLLDGETVDARRTLQGWDEAGFDDADWDPVTVDVVVAPRLVAQPNEPMEVTAEVRPVAVSEPAPGVQVFDLGQNIVGWVRLRASAPRGTTATLRHGEVLDSDGSVYTRNLRSAAQLDRYTFAGRGEEVFEPRFTYHGFRYVEVRGLDADLDLTSLTGCVVHSAAPLAGEFESSSPLLDRLMRAIHWTQRGNMHGMPTDCPQRDERLGWMGDAQVFSQTACFNRDMAAFFTKWLHDVRSDQAADGRFPDFAPHPFDSGERFSAAPGWADAGVIIPWRLWVNYADRRALEVSFEPARRWVDWVRSANPDLIWETDRGNDYGDWLNGDTLRIEGWSTRGAAVPRPLLATAYFARSADLVARMAHVLEREEDARTYRRLAQEIRAAFRERFLEKDGRLDGDTQAGYALALHFDLLPADLRPGAASRLVHGIEARKGHLSTGIQASGKALLELSRHGHTDVAYALALSRDAPSWGYMLDHGATTIWERWDGFIEGRGYQDPGMNSFNHFALGAVGEWVYRVVLGIRPIADRPGFEHVIIRPEPGAGLAHARGSHDTIRGRISVDWERTDEGLALGVEIPVGATATVYVPAPRPASVFEGERPAASAPSVRLLRRDDAQAVYMVGSGRYAFRVEKAPK